MATFTCFLVFVTMAASLVDVTQSVCSVGVSGSCQTTIQQLYQSSIPDSVSGYDSYCSSVSSTCSSTLTNCSCTAAGSERSSCLDFLGLKDAINFICSSTTNRGVFTNNRECITEYVEDAISTCRVVSNENCADYNNAYRCFYGGMSVICNKETADMMTRFELKRYKPLLDNVPCTIDLDQTALSSCSASVVDSCLQNVTNLYLHSPTDASTYDAFCRQVTSTCSRTLTDCTCTESTSTVGQNCLSYIGLKAGMIYVCSDENNRKVFRENRQCIVDNTDTVDTTCQQKYTKDCSGYLSAFKCFYDSMKSKCNQGVAEMLTKFKLFAYYPLLKSAGCKIDLSVISPTTTNAASTLVSSTALAALCLIVTNYAI